MWIRKRRFESFSHANGCGKSLADRGVRERIWNIDSPVGDGNAPANIPTINSGMIWNIDSPVGDGNDIRLLSSVSYAPDLEYRFPGRGRKLRTDI